MAVIGILLYKHLNVLSGLLGQPDIVYTRSGLLPGVLELMKERKVGVPML